METALTILAYALAVALAIGAAAFAIFGAWIIRKFNDHEADRERITEKIDRGAKWTRGRP